MSSRIVLLFALILFTEALPSNRQKQNGDKSIVSFDIALNEEDFKNAAKLQKEASADFHPSGMYNKELFEGDMILGNELKSLMSPSRPEDGPVILKAAIRNDRYRWPNAKIPYVISSQFEAKGRAVVAAAMQEYAEKTCIRFEPKQPNDTDYISIKPLSGCYSYVGRAGGEQDVSLGSNCLERFVVMHELMHAAGFFHEQSRPDRDDNIKVLFENIQDGAANQFDKESNAVADTQGTAYDYGSIMHYDQFAFSKNNQPTIKALKEGVTLGNKQGFSPTDIQELNALYKCPNGRSVPEIHEVVTRENVH